MTTTTMKAAKACAATLLAMALGACATKLGRDFDDAYAQQIKPGATTKAEVRARLGEPSLVTGTPDEEIWTYAYYQGKNLFLFGEVYQGTGSQKRLIVTFKGDGVAESQFRREIPMADRANRF